MNDNVCCGVGYECPPNADETGNCPSGNECFTTVNGQVRSKDLAIGIFDRYWDQSSHNFGLQPSTVQLQDLDERIIVPGPVTGDVTLTGSAIVDEAYPDQDIESDVAAGAKGWYFHLFEDRERCVGEFLVYREVVFFLTYNPVNYESDPCLYGPRSSNLYGVYYKSGTSTITPVFDLTGDRIVDEGDKVRLTLAGKEVGAAMIRVQKAFAGGAAKAKGDVIYLPLGITINIRTPTGDITGVTSWREGR